MKIQKLYKTTLILGLLSALGACQNQTHQQTAQQSLQLKTQGSAAAIVDSVQVSGRNQILIASEREGLALRQGGSLIAHLPGAFKQVRLSELGDNQWLYAALEGSKDSVFVGTLDASSEQLLPRFELSQTGLLVDNFCLFADRANQTLSLFVSDGRGRGEQWLLRQQQSWLQTPLLLRSLSLPYDADSCAVDPGNGYLYVSEPLGIWRYSARIEDNPQYYPVSLVAPYGSQSEPAISLATSDSGELFALLENGQEVLYWDTPDAANSWLPAETLVLKNHKATMMNLSQPLSTDKATLSFTNEQQGQFTTAQFTLNSAFTTQALPIVRPAAQSQPALQFGDAMDDPAIWVHPANPDASRVLGTHKKQGLEVYDLQGKLLQEFKDGRLNNVDLRDGFSWQGRTISIAAASKRNDDSLAFYGIEANGNVFRLGSAPSGLEEIYGLCMAIFEGNHYVFANNKAGLTFQYRVKAYQDKLHAEKVREIPLSSQPEGCVADDARGRLFIGEEDVGIWATSLNPADNSQPVTVAKVGEHLVDDVEGLALSFGDAPVLVVSSQGNNSYQLYEATPPYRHLAGFRVGLDGFKGIDGASETDGLALSTRLRTRDYPEGLLVLQDGRNRFPDQPQNFKYVSWRDVLESTGLAKVSK
ncbi:MULTISPECIES: phytase [unclassified Pseudoalteromonas]|uniref:phytase n=1 Tax=unclassified Pseudoalteromonas TaxID=194690 RepID=UPI0020972D88|nr:phytase [Pseudoalteromonas sp. XMcav2-N]MCO7187480.1 phytase [Pseudoalteromonas sp. XMcav2-N]